MIDFGPMTHSKEVRCPECGLNRTAVADQYGQVFKVARHDVGANLGNKTNIICPGGKVR